MVQSGKGARPIRRWDSWYDNQLVTRVGEDVLTQHDTWAIPELRRNRLIWSGWGPALDLTGHHIVIPNTKFGYREVLGIDRTRLRLFFLSLLWRAAASQRFEFSEIDMPADHLEQLRQMLVTANPEPLSFYPTQLTQHSTMGTIHNLTPIQFTKVLPGLDGEDDRPIPTFRFYFDGLVAHMHRHASDSGETASLGPLVVGGEDKLVLSTVPFEGSFEHQNLARLQIDAALGWSDLMAKL
jgi:hypothetical protein